VPVVFAFRRDIAEPPLHAHLEAVRSGDV
jgi:hypothetical protein